MSEESKTTQTNLSERMRNLHAAGTHDLPQNWLELADNFDAATQAFWCESPTISVMQFMGHFARARKAWCAVTGESLV